MLSLHLSLMSSLMLVRCGVALYGEALYDGSLWMERVTEKQLTAGGHIVSDAQRAEVTRLKALISEARAAAKLARDTGTVQFGTTRLTRELTRA
jgi:hypothetical protein